MALLLHPIYKGNAGSSLLIWRQPASSRLCPCRPRIRFRGTSLAAEILLTLCLIALNACGNSQARTGAPLKAAPKSPLTVVFSAEQNGYLTPCGCSKPMLGGVPRRAAYLRSLEPQTALVRVENGDLTMASGRQDELKAETLTEMLNDLKYDAINLGEKDFRLGLPYLQSLQSRFKGDLLCANARATDGGALFKEYAVVKRDVAGGSVRVVIMGLLSEQFREEVAAVNPDVRLDPPHATLERLQAEVAAQGEARVLLYHGPMTEAEEIAQRFSGFQLIVSAHEGDHPVDMKRTGNTALACSGQDGKYVGAATLAPGSAWLVTSVKYTALSPDFAEDPHTLQIKAVYLERVAAEDLLGQVVKSPTANGDTFAGSAACAPCHAEAQRIWKDSAHARAMQTLINEKHDKDPECVGCHVVGLERGGGFVSREKTPRLQDVGCESCHGAAARHAQNPKSPMPKVGSASCLGCHNPQHSPHFDFERYWLKIKH